MEHTQGGLAGCSGHAILGRPEPCLHPALCGAGREVTLPGEQERLSPHGGGDGGWWGDKSSAASQGELLSIIYWA